MVVKLTLAAALMAVCAFLEGTHAEDTPPKKVLLDL
jgi:hypothetical protein